MQRLLGRVAAHFLGSAVLRSDTVVPAPAPGTPLSHRVADAFARFVDRWESSPELLGEERTQDALVIGFFAAFSLIGWLMVMQGYEQLRQADAVEDWPTVEGTIVAVDMRAVEGPEGPRWRSQVTYTYNVNGRRITAIRITPGTGVDSNKKIPARDNIRDYLPQTPVTVHYNPVEITESVLDPAVPRSAYMNLALGAGLACLGPALFMLVGMPASRRRGWLFWRRP